MSLRWLIVLAATASAAELKVDQLAADLQRARDELAAFESSSAKHLAWLRAEVEKASSAFEVEKREAALAKREQAAFEVSDVEDSGAGQLKVTYNSGPKECTDADRVKVGDQISLRYTLKIDESSATGNKGMQYDSGVFDTKIGVGRVIPGWDKGLIGLCKNAKWTLVVPPEMGYGSKGMSDIPGGATLNFDVEVISLTVGGPEPNLFKEIDFNEDGKLSTTELLMHFKKQNPDTWELPPGLMENEDKDKDNHVSWEEFSGPKGNKPPVKDEL